jgi:poly(3-hydroxybutyrate) depolymerase
MRTVARSLVAIGSVAVLCLGAAAALAQGGPPPQVLPEGIRGGSEVVPEKGVEIRKYIFKETGEELPYSVYVSSKIKKGKKAPLVIALRGYTGTTLTIVRGSAVDLAEAGGYILVGALGYNNRAWFGMDPNASRRGGPPPAGPGAGAGPGAAAGGRAGGTPGAGAPGGGGPRGQPPLVGGAELDAVKSSAYSEKDVMNVLAMVRKEFKIDDKRIYIMGHSQGGGGARHLVEKYPDIWAGVALLAPALFGAGPTAGSPITKVPLLLAVGDKDSLVASARSFSEQLDALQVKHEFVVKAGLDHGTIIMGSMPEVFAFFPKHVKGRR